MQKTSEDIHNHSASYCKFVPVKVASCSASALVDSGNVWRNVISEAFFNRLGFSKRCLRPLPGVKVGTAKANSTLEVLGELTFPLKITLGDHPTKFRFQPVVLRNLAMDVNLCGPFLKEYGIDQIHSRNCLKVQNRFVPVYAADYMRTRPEATSSGVYVAERRTLPPRSVSVVAVTVAEMAKANMDVGEGVLICGEDALGGRSRKGEARRNALLSWNNVLVTPGEKGKLLAGIMNLDDEPVVLPKGTKYGDFVLSCSEEQTEQATPWRIGLLEGPGKGPTLKEKMKTAIAKAAAGVAAGSEPVVKPKDKWSRKEKEDWVMKQFRLKEASALSRESDRKRVVDLLVDYFDVLSVNGEYGQTDLLEHEIHTKEGPPIKCKHRPVNPALEPVLLEQIDKWKKHDVIEPSCSPWSFPLVAAPKKNGTIRWCVDYRRLNDITVKDTFPLPNIEDNLARLSESRVFSCVDGSGAFHVIKIRKKDRPKTAFSTPWGTFHYKRMPFGLTNGPASYSRLVQLVLNGIPPRVAIPYLDDTIIHSRDVESHIKNLKVVLEAHRRAGLKLQPEKCYLFQTEVDYLGHSVSADGVKPQTGYVQLVKDWPVPKTKSEARVFLGKVGYYRRFIKNYSRIARPWTDVTGTERTDDPVADKEREKAPLTVTPEMKEAFLNLKRRLTEAPILAYPRFQDKEPFILDTDWSQESGTIGGVLSQVQEGKERVILYGAKRLAKSQANYAPFKGELTAITYFLKQWRYYLRFRKFILRTDHLPLKYMKTMEPPDLHTSRLLDILANYDFEIRHRAGKAHGNADGLSRAPHVQNMEPAAEAVGTDEELAEVSALTVTGGDGDPLSYTADDLCQLQEADADLKTVRSWVKREQAPSQAEIREGSPGNCYLCLLVG